MSQDLTRQTDLFLRLIDDDEWRERVVEEFVFGSGEHARVVSTYQLALSPEVAAQVTEHVPDTARVLLPLTTRDKRPLLNFAVSGPGGSDALLFPRGFTAVLQATYLHDLLEVAGVPEPFGPATDDLLEAICVFTPALFQHFVKDAGTWHRGIARYLTSGLAIEVTATRVEQWCAAAEAPAERLLERLREPSDPLSSAEHVLLALPRMALRPASVEEIDKLVAAYHEGLITLADAGTDDFLRMLAEYGRRWQMILDLEAPIGQRFKVRVAEDRPFSPQGRGLSRQRFALGDAGSGHLEVRVVDHSVRLGRKLLVRELLGGQLPPGLLEAERFTPEVASVYSSQPERPRLEVGVDPPPW